MNSPRASRRLSIDVPAAQSLPQYGVNGAERRDAVGLWGTSTTIQHLPLIVGKQGADHPTLRRAAGAVLAARHAPAPVAVPLPDLAP